ncbi:class I SAM-dependent methyltransferase [Agilicoccus flavus]|uniref:class I SAM-dependent methyltransferase n=1 Tax=Agilicoccus flavus TaxID=2775968 RepID=UPI001CF682E9|nr:class I SAM-dependent methyltransferase [Agilicoccus flavus]
MLTVDFDRLGVRRGDRALDLGCGQGRHAFELYRRGLDVVAFDQNESDLADVETMFGAMADEGEGAPGGARVRAGDALAMPFADSEFDVVVASEILEHIPDDRTAIAEAVRVLRPGGLLAVSVPRAWPERICWALSREYHEVEGGHVRIYREDRLAGQLTQAGVDVFDRSYAHALHSPYWWLKCAVGVDDAENRLVAQYHRLLVWDMMSAPALTRTAERLLDPVAGKCVVLYARKPG